MKKLLQTLFLLLFLSSCSVLQKSAVTPVPQTVVNYPIKGYDILGLAMQDADMLAANIEPGSAIGVLEGTFGPVIPNLKKLLNTGKPIAFRAHLNNYPCIRNHRCEPGEPRPNDLQTLAKRAKAFEDLHALYPNVLCYLSPMLESDVKDQNLVNSWFQVIKEAAPSCTPVCSTFQGWCPAGPLSEQHGNSAHADIVSNDGQEIWDADTGNYWHHGRILSLAWYSRFNGSFTGSKVFIPPSKRRVKARDVDIQQINALMEDVAPVPHAPALCKKLIKFKAPEILKSNAEDYAKGAPRDNKPVALINPKYNNGFTIYSPDGRKIGCASNPHNLPPFGRLNRYYVGECSNKANTEVLKSSGSEWVFYKNGNNCYLGNAVRRLGSYK